MSKIFTIAIDGPVASGKGTLAVGLAKKLGILFIYTGAMYRALTYVSIRENIDIHNDKEVLHFLKGIKIELREPGPNENRTFSVFVNEEDVTGKIFDKEIEEKTPIVAAMGSIREVMVSLQQQYVKGRSAIVEGRDSSTHVLPNADLKIYLTASLEKRAERRYLQLKKKSIERPIAQIIEDIKERDKKDMERSASPLTIVPDAFVIDTTNLNIEETIEKVMEKLKEKGLP